MVVFVPTHLRSYTGGSAQVEGRGSSLAEVLADLDGRFPGFRFRVVDEQDQVRTHILFFVSGTIVRDLQRPLPANAEVTIVAALSGG